MTSGMPADMCEWLQEDDLVFIVLDTVAALMFQPWAERADHRGPVTPVGSAAAGWRILALRRSGCYVSRPASVSCTLPPFHWLVTSWLVTSLAGLSWSREKRCSRPWWRASTRSVLAPAISADPCVE
jgi:hypothetical protein